MPGAFAARGTAIIRTGSAAKVPASVSTVAATGSPEAEKWSSFAGKLRFAAGASRIFSCSPSAGASSVPESGASVLVIKGGPGGEEQCVCGGKQAEVPKGMQPGGVYIYGPKGSNVYLQKDGTIELTGRISIRGQLLVNGELYKPCTCGGGL